MVYKLPQPNGKVRWGVEYRGWRFEIYPTKRRAQSALEWFRRNSELRGENG